jgi:hypothetical protein
MYIVIREFDHRNMVHYQPIIYINIKVLEGSNSSFTDINKQETCTPSNIPTIFLFMAKYALQQLSFRCNGLVYPC